LDYETAIEVKSLSKKYRLGTIGMTSLREDLSRLWNRKKTEEQPTSSNGTIDDPRKINDHEFWALNDLNFSIRKGEVIGLIGANGSGKSTLLKILSRITEPTKGEVKVRGRVASLLEVGTGFHPELTGRENVYVNGAILGMTRKEVTNKFDEIVDFAGVSDFIDTPIKRYSSGMTVRLGFAVAAHLDPDILIVDEVLAVGDAAFQEKCIGKMKNISSGGKTILLVSHQMPMIENLCSSCILLNNGEIKSQGFTDSVIQNYYDVVLPSKSNSQNIIDRKDRNGTGELKLVDIKLKSKDGAELSFLRNGEAAIFHFQFSGTKSTIEKPSFRFGIDTNSGKRITTIDSRMINFKMEPADNFSIDVKIKRLNLSEGNYFVTTFLGVGEMAIDWLPNAIQLKVVNGDFYETGRAQKVGNGEILTEFGIEYKEN
jgi:lipopolysaccharide transport system ATP-binding protein